VCKLWYLYPMPPGSLFHVNPGVGWYHDQAVHNTKCELEWLRVLWNVEGDKITKRVDAYSPIHLFSRVKRTNNLIFSKVNCSLFASLSIRNRIRLTASHLNVGIHLWYNEREKTSQLELIPEPVGVALLLLLLLFLLLSLCMLQQHHSLRETSFYQAAVSHAFKPDAIIAFIIAFWCCIDIFLLRDSLHAAPLK